MPWKRKVKTKHAEACKRARLRKKENEKKDEGKTEEIPDFCNNISRREALKDCLKDLLKTEIKECIHSPCICVVCDSFIIGKDSILWLSEDQLLSKQFYLSVQYLESVVQKKMPTALRNQYKIESNKNLSQLLLSPKIHIQNALFMSC